jgi:DNA-binding MarR family transcriptional regulator/GNAT superfamily N-acetyltransferase
MIRMDDSIAAVRRFNRFYTKQIGVLQEGLLSSPYSLTEVRILYELSQRQRASAAEIGKELGLDKGYLSRLLVGLKQRRLISSKASDADRRESILSLTRKGQRAFAALNSRSSEEVGAMLGSLPAADQKRLVQSIRSIETLLGGEAEQEAPYLLRSHQPGDLGWIVHLHGKLYAREYGFDVRFEALVANIVASFIEHYDSRREQCWIAESGGEIVGSAFLVAQSNTMAKLRLLLVHPKARGLGIGRRLVDECIGFATKAGYRKITLWTQSILLGARHIYEQAGFRLVREEPHQNFGCQLIGETWELKL